MASAAIGLKRLRQRAVPAVTIRRMAELLEMPATSYGRYEDPNAFKKSHLPMGFAQDVARVLADYGVDRAEVLRLAGVGEEVSQVDALSQSESQLLDRFRQLDPDRRRLTLELVDAMLPGRPPGATLHSGRQAYTAQPREIG